MLGCLFRKQVEIDEPDFLFFVVTARFTLRVANISEVMLLALDASLQDIDLNLRVIMYLVNIVKTIMQVKLTNGCMQLRRDRYLVTSNGLSASALARLRSAPAKDDDQQLFSPCRF